MEHKTIIPVFVAKTYAILQDPDYQSVISWSSNGKQFLIKKVHELESKVLPKYFRHNNLNSFIRQLNMHGFHKSRKDHSKIVFAHQFFLQGSPELLQKIKRKTKNQIFNDENIESIEINPQNKDLKQKFDKSLRKQKIIQKVQNNVILKQDPTDQFKDTYQTISSSTSIMFKPLWSLENTIQEFATKQQYPFRCFIQKSEIFDLKPNLGINSESKDYHQNLHFLNLNEEEEENTSIDGEFAEKRRQMENETNRIPSIRTFHFLNELQF